MKKILLIASICVCSALQTFAQGQFTFANKGFENPAPIYKDIVGSSTKIGTGYYVDYVYAKSTGVTDSSTLTLTELATPKLMSGTAGTFGGGDQTIPGYTGTISLQIRAWESSYTTYAAAVASGSVYTGASKIMYIPLGNPNANPPSVITSLDGYLTSFAVTVPEPATVALGVMGLSLLVFRRRK
jgi:hypothetical protein